MFKLFYIYYISNINTKLRIFIIFDIPLLLFIFMTISSSQYLQILYYYILIVMHLLYLLHIF